MTAPKTPATAQESTRFLLEITAPHHVKITTGIFDRFPLRIGRSYDNDIILHDDYAEAHHAQIECDGGYWILRDLGSANGMKVNGKTCDSPLSILRSGDEFMLGRTIIHIYHPQHAVAAAKKMYRVHPSLTWMGSSWFVWLLFCVTVAVASLWTYLNVWEDDMAVTLTSAAGATMTVILVWAGIWSLVGKLARHASRFRTHIFIASLYILASTLVYSFSAYLHFLTNESMLAVAADYLFNFMLIVPLIAASLGVATEMPAQKRSRIAALFSLGLMTGIFTLTLIGNKEFDQQPKYPSVLEPYLSNLAPVTKLEDFAAGNEKAFNAKIFKHAP